MPTVALDLLPTQDDFFSCDDPRAAFVGGLGSGKSRVGSDLMISWMVRYPRARHFVFSNTFPQLKSGTLQTFYEACERWGLKYVARVQGSGDTVYLPDIGARCEVWTADNPHLFRSLEIDKAWVDEAHKWPEAAFKILLGRMRGSDRSRRRYPGMPVQLRLTANPPWTSDHWLVHATTDPMPLTGKPLIRLFTASTFDNPFLPDEYVRTLMESYDPELADIELKGQYGDIGRGRIWRRFVRHKHVLSDARANEVGLPALEWDPHQPICWSHDFNVDPLCSVLFQWRRVQVKGYQRIVMYVLDELHIRDAVIDSALREFLTRPAAKIARRSGLILYGDAAGEARNRQTGQSDWAALRKGLALAGFVGEARVPSANPQRRDRFNAGNAKLENARGEIGVVIHERCQKLVRDLAGMYYKPGTSEPLVPKVEEGMTTVTLTHLADAWSYGIARDFPVTDMPSGPMRTDR